MTCNQCKEETTPGAFATFRDRKGVQRRRGVCKLCRGKYATDNFDRLQQWRKEYNAKNKTQKQERDADRRAEGKEYVDAIKARTPCSDCKQKFPPVCMDFDHIHDDKIKGVANLVGGAYRLELIKEEIAKCELVCACCHRLRTQTRKQNHAPKAQQQ